MSLFSVKSWRGTYLNFSGVMSCVVFKTLSNVLANLVLIYFSAFSAQVLSAKAPMLRNVSVLPVFGTSTIGVPIILAGIGLPIVPAAPSARAINTLYLCRLDTGRT